MRNQGASSSSSTTLRYYSSANAQITTSDDQLATDPIAGLPPSAQSSQSDEVFLSTPGTFWVGACVDTVSGEVMTTNQCSEGVEIVVTSVPRPDLIVQLLEVDDDSLVAGTSLLIDAVVRNQGSGASSATTLRYFRSSDPTITTDDFQMAADIVGGLQPRTNEGVSEEVPISILGAHWIGACVVAVSGETAIDNQCSVGAPIVVSTPGIPDLVVDIGVSHETILAGEDFTIVATVRNQGLGSASPTTLRYYLSDDDLIAVSDMQIATDSVLALSPEATSTESATVSIPTPRLHWVGACADSVAGEIPTDKPIRRADILRPLAKELGASIRTGRMGQRKVAGFFIPFLETLRLKKRDDIEVAAHELAHLLDDRFPEIRKQWHPATKKNAIFRDELREISYDRRLLFEGFAEFELELIRERVKAGMDRARRQGHRIGRPSVWERRGFKTRFGAVLERLRAGQISRRQAARELDIGYATLKRLLDEHGQAAA